MLLFVGIFFGLSFQFCIAVNGRLGGDVLLTCDVTGSIKYLRWEKTDLIDNQWIFQDLQPDDSKYDGINQSDLTIKHLTYNDAAYYRCRVEKSNRQLLYGSQSYVSVKEYKNGILGQSTTLNCNTVGLYTFRWELDNWFITFNPSKYQGYDSSTLTIFNTEKTDAGNYKCHVYYQNGDYFDMEPEIIVVIEPVNGNWGSWSYWTQCSPCGVDGWSSRTRECNNPAPANGGEWCGTDNKENKRCFINCPVNGNWGSWTPTSSCSATCGDGTISRSRLCDSPSPAYGGSYCSGSNTNTVFCSMDPCPVNGNWGVWSLWNTCTTTCGDGKRTKTRTCTNPAPSNGGAGCVGSSTDSLICSSIPCPVEGGWSVWLEWSLCTASCGEGNRSRNRKCDNPLPANNGKTCDGSNKATETCSIKMCPSNEALAKTDIIPHIAGGAVGGLAVIVIVVIGVVIFMKRRKNDKVPHHRSSGSQKLDRTAASVNFRAGHGSHRNEKGNYLNVGSSRGASYTDTDEEVMVVPPEPVPKPTAADQEPDNTYYNTLPVLTNIKVADLKGYIQKMESQNKLVEEYQNLPYGVQYPTTIAQTKDNMPKNRFKTTFPYDHTRVMLSSGSDYINANYVDGFETEKRYIASQGPLKHTFADHWRMIWQNDIRKILMLTNLVEGGRKKCDKYWPDGERPVTFGNYVLTLLSEKERAAYVTREISVEDKTTKERRQIKQYHFTAWPDHGTPDPLYLVLFHKYVMSDESVDSVTKPLLVHCSAGIGRTGTFIALDALYEEGKTTEYVDVVKYVKKMRYCRMNMVQTQEQYVCLHHALLEAFTMKDTNIAKNDFGKVWRNMSSDKRPINQQGLNEEFKLLEEKKEEHAKAEHVAASSPKNIDKNRDKSVLPSDQARLYLSSFEKGRTDYINAVHTPSYTKFVGYLATQLPLKDTMVDFWTMIRDHNSSTCVLFLTDPGDENLFYNESTNTSMCGPNTVKISNTSKEECGIKVTNIILTRKDDKARDIAVYQTVCKDPPTPETLCKLVNLISTRISMSEGPVTVVSSDGARLCGLFCTFTNAVSSMTIDNSADIFQLARLLQLQRPECFKDFEEYRRCYEALNFYLESTNVYANF